MKYEFIMESAIKNSLQPSSPPDVPHHFPSTSPLPPILKESTPPPLMSINSFPHLDQPEFTSPPRKSRKRDTKYFGNRFLFENVFKENDQNWQRFFIMSRREGNFSNISPFLYCSQIIQTIGKPKSVQKMASGSLNIEVVSVAQANLLINLKKLGDEEISVEPNKRLNTSKGVVVCRDFMICSEEEIKIGMEDQGVIEVRRINRRQGGSLVATASLILTFDRPEPPEQIEAAFYKLKVRKFIPSPMRCFKCLKFGHTSVRCRSIGQMCACGLIVHEDAPCQDPPVCVNCAELHSSRSPECYIFREEKEIQKIKTLQRVPYHEARQIVKSTSYVKPQISYATAAKAKKVTEIKDWQKILQPYVFKGNQGPSQPVWAAQSVTGQSEKSQIAFNRTENGVVSHPSPLGDQDNSLAPLPQPLSHPLPLAADVERRTPGLRVTARPSPSRLPPRSPPHRTRPSRQAQATMSLRGPLPKGEVKAEAAGGTASTRLAKDSKPPRVEPINWVSSREEHGSDSDTGDSNRTVLTDAGQVPPMERPVVRRKRKGTIKSTRK